MCLSIHLSTPLRFCAPHANEKKRNRIFTVKYCILAPMLLRSGAVTFSFSSILLYQAITGLWPKYNDNSVYYIACSPAVVLLLNKKELPFPGVVFFPLFKLRSGQYTDTTGHKDDHNGVIAADSQLDVCRRRSRASKATRGGGTLGHWDGLWVIERHLVHRSRTPQGANSMSNTSDFLSNQ